MATTLERPDTGVRPTGQARPRAIGYGIKRLILGPALPTSSLEHERLGKRTALAVFASDNLSSVAYATERSAFGRPIGADQGLAFQIADMEAAVHVARLAWYDAAWRAVSGLPFSRQAAVAKLVASEAAVANARTAAQVFGGYGFMNDYPVGRFYRDAKILEIGEGTSEVQRMIIARSLGLPLGR